MPLKSYTFTFFLCLLLSFQLSVEALDDLTSGLFTELCNTGIHADLKEPHYSDGVLTTSKGGVISGPNMRIQAQNITYARKVVDGQPSYTVEAEGDLMLEFNGYVFKGRHLSYDFQSKTGFITHGRSSVEPWYFGGERILLQADDSYLIEHGFVTTSEAESPDWKITSEIAKLYPNNDFSAAKVNFKFFNTPLFWLPSLNINLDYIFDSPIRYSARWGGKQGPRAEFIYEIFSWNHLKTFLRFDYRLTRGPGLGFETYYHTSDNRINFETINYVARDSSIQNPNEKIRYRFQGAYSHLLMDDKISVQLVYDKLSDKFMATDYADSGLDLEYVGLTRLQVRRQEKDWISNLVTTVRLNNFQSMKQELPTYEVSHRPYEIAPYGIITESSGEASYLDYKYANNLKAHDYHSARIECQQRMYRPFHFSGLNFTPDLGGVAIYYSNVPKKQ